MPYFCWEPLIVRVLFPSISQSLRMPAFTSSYWLSFTSSLTTTSSLLLYLQSHYLLLSLCRRLHCTCFVLFFTLCYLLLNSHTCNFFLVVVSCAHRVYTFAVFHCLQPTYIGFVLHHGWGKYSMARPIFLKYFIMCMRHNAWVNCLQGSSIDFNCIYSTDTSHNDLKVLVNRHRIHLM